MKMKKVLTTVSLATALIIGGGTGMYYVSAKENNMADMSPMMQGEMGDMSDMLGKQHPDMSEMMNENSMNFEQMQEVHPDLTENQFREHNNCMHETDH